MKKLIFGLMLVAALMSTSAYGYKIIGTWQAAADPCGRVSGDGWIDWNWGSNPGTVIGPMPNTRYASSTIGATQGNKSLKLTYPTGSATQYLSLHNYQSTLNFQMSDLLSNTRLEVDITYDSASWAADTSFASVYTLSMQTATYGWNDVGGGIDHTNYKVRNGVMFNDTLNPGYAGYLPIVDPGTTLHTWTGKWIWEYSAILPGGSYTAGPRISTADTWVNFIFAWNAGGSGGSYYVDNIRLVPEPTTIAMLCLGGLALLRKRS